MSTNKPHEIRQDDELKTWSGVCRYIDSTGTDVVQDLTGYACTFTMINHADGTVVIDADPATIVTAASGLVSYDFAAADVATPGVYWVTIKATSGGKVASFPVRPGDSVVWIHGANQTAQEAYRAAVDVA